MKKTGKQDLTALIVDDHASICDTLAGVLSDEGWKTVAVSSGKEGIDLLRKRSFDLVLLDVWMKGLDGIQTLQKMKELNDTVPIVIMSGHGTIETAVKATKLGAFDYLEKPLSLEKLLPMIEHAEKLRSVGEQGWSKGHEFIGQSEFVASIHRQIKIVAPRNSWILITGENGTGKEVVARNIHLQSPRAEKAFVAVNCAAIPEELIETELFGHSKGAFTNAISAKLGKFELAHKGTLFLDEIGDMSLKTQAKILRILQEQAFERIGDVNTIKVDVRVIAATNKNLQQEIKVNRFREDLFYRLNVIPIHMLPLREHVADVPVLAEHFLIRMAEELSEPRKRFTEEAMMVLKAYPWPGNVRELRNVIERVAILVPQELITLKDIEALLNSSTPGEAISSPISGYSTLKEARSVFEKAFILDKLQENEWNVAKTAEAIGIERSNLHRKLRAYAIDPNSHKPRG